MCTSCINDNIKQEKYQGGFKMNQWREKPALSVPEAAQVLGISRSLAFKLANSGEIPARRLGAKRLIVPTKAIVQMLEQAAAK